jgi:hypothetical protein
MIISFFFVGIKRIQDVLSITVFNTRIPLRIQGMTYFKYLNVKLVGPALCAMETGMTEWNAMNSVLVEIFNSWSSIQTQTGAILMQADPACLNNTAAGNEK